MYGRYFEHLLKEEIAFDVNNSYLFHEKKVIYILRGISWLPGTYKVGGWLGSFCRLKKRLSSYNTGCPENEKRYFICLFAVDNYLKVEKELKLLLKDYRQKTTEIYENIDYNKLVTSIKSIISV